MTGFFIKFSAGDGEGPGAVATSISTSPANFTKIGLETKWSVGETCALTR